MATILYVSPHADDESLSMGSSIRNHLEDGHDIHVLLLTTGVSSGALGPSGLTVEEFAAARDDEYMRALRRLGVRYPNIHFASDRPANDELTVEVAQAQIEAWLAARDPGVWLKTYSFRPANGRHQHHVDTGVAAHNLLAEGAVANLRCYVEPWLLGAFKTANPGVNVGVESATGSAVVKAAVGEYKAHDGVGAKYGIGYMSVPTVVDGAIADPRNYYHAP